MVLLNMYGERIGTEVRHIRRKIKKIKSCVCHDREFKSYFKIWGKSAQKVLYQSQNLQQNRIYIYIYIYIYIAYIIHVRSLSYTYKHIYVHARENYFKELAHSIVVWQVQNLQCSPAGWRADVSDVQKTLWKKHGIKLRTVLQKTSGKIEAIRKIYIIGYRYFTKPLYTVVFFSIADGVIVT